MPLFTAGTEERNAVFQRLKPPCVNLSQAALSLSGPKPDIPIVNNNLEELSRTLDALTKERNNLDLKLADYAFFPLSQVLKNSQKLSLQSLEVTLQCLAVLISHGWRSQIQHQLAGQLLVLCTIMADKKPPGLGVQRSSDELQLAAMSCLRHLFDAVADSTEGHKVFTGDSSVPQLGQTLTVVLEAIDQGASVNLQMSASAALAGLLDAVRDRELLATFLPGIVSKLTAVLRPQTKQRRNHRVLVGCLDTLRELLGSLLNDAVTESVRSSSDVARVSGPSLSKTSVIDAAWLETAASKLKPALANAMRLQDHSRDNVKYGLGELCLTLLSDCIATLPNVSTMATEILVVLVAGMPDSSLKARTSMLSQTKLSFSDVLQEVLHEWLQSLTHIMQSADEAAKVQRLRQISVAHGILVDSGVDTTSIDRTMAAALRDGVVITLQLPRGASHPSTLISPIQSLDLTAPEPQATRKDYDSALASYRGQEDVLLQLERTVSAIARTKTSSAFAADISRALYHSAGEAQIANFWLLYLATKQALQGKDEIDTWLVVSDSDKSRANLEDLYAFALSLLTDVSDEPIDPRMRALALRTLALRAEKAGQEFRYELVEALYPVLHTLATPDDRLQKDSITTLNILTAACGYSDAKSLIVENADYLTNAVALKLNAFDISPQAPQVLLMMVRLAGPSLLPYLEDTVDSIFAALENYHGYPLLVELLFRVLSVVAEEGVKAPQLAIKDTPRKQMVGIEKETYQLMDLATLIGRLRDNAEEQKALDQEAVRVTKDSHPKKSWGKPKEEKQANATEKQNEEEEMMHKHDQQIDDSEPPPPAPKVYNLLFQITELTQHFLPSASPSLRASLLSLIKTTTPAIAKHENTFLPLINTLWPEIVSRLDDPEPHVSATALDIIGELCEYAGDFMRGRILQLRPALVEMHAQIAKDIVRANSSSKQPESSSRSHQSNTLTVTGHNLKSAVARMQASPADYLNTSSRLLWEAFTNMLTTVVRRVPLPWEAFEDVLEMLEPLLEDKEVREVLEAENADAVWFARLRSGAIPAPTMPTLPAGSKWRLVDVAG